MQNSVRISLLIGLWPLVTVLPQYSSLQFSLASTDSVYFVFSLGPLWLTVAICTNFNDSFRNRAKNERKSAEGRKTIYIKRCSKKGRLKSPKWRLSLGIKVKSVKPKPKTKLQQQQRQRVIQTGSSSSRFCSSRNSTKNRKKHKSQSPAINPFPISHSGHSPLPSFLQ